MPYKAPSVQVGEEWAYREKARNPAVRVEVVRVGTSRPPRVRVRFLGEEFEGREDWIPPNRLKVLWSDATAWQARENRWDAVREASNHVEDTPEYWAVSAVFDAVGDDLLDDGYGASAGVLIIPNPEALVAKVGIGREQLLDDPLAFVDDDGTLVAPWVVTLSLAQQLAPRFAEQILDEVARSEARQAQEAIYGKDYGGRNPWYVSPEICAETAEKWQPSYDLLREWCGATAVDRHDELLALRAEILRVGQVAERAIRELEATGHDRVAKQLERELGVPVETLRASQEHRRS
jgi:hypothetical protein